MYRTYRTVVKTSTKKAQDSETNIHKEKVGKSGGQLIIWDSNCFEVANSFVSNHCIRIRGKWKSSGKDFCVINVYGLHDDENKLKLWDVLYNLLLVHKDEAWVICGDFNEVRNVDERLNCNFIESWAKRFNEFIVNSGLIDVPMGGRIFTRVSDDGLKFSKLDRFLINGSFQNVWACLSVVALDRGKSDHCPIIIKDDVKNFGPKPIKVFDDWLDIDGADEIIKETWGENGGGGSRLDCCLRNKLKKTKLSLKAISSHKFGNLEGEIEFSKANTLEFPISEAEIVEALNDCGSSKAPGLDGFNLRFFEKFWDVIKVDVEVPKKCDPIILSDFRPISLIGSLYKIVAKILSNRLKRVLPRLVGSEQSAFLKERYILDGVLVANKSIDFIKSNNKKGIIFKVAFEKAFDCLNWDFLMEVMSSMEFGAKWRKWILACLSSASISVLINGSPTREFPIGRGVRQGDPLSPFLFILAAEGLNFLTKAAINRGLFRGVEIGKDKVLVSHLQYADDTMLFRKWSRINARNLINILKCFELALGLKVNLHKSCLYGVGVNSVEVEDLPSRMGCQAGKFPFIYLGLPIGAKMKKLSDWDPVINKFKRRLSEWKMRTLSFGGRLVLLKSVLNSLPLYYFSLFRAPTCVLKLLESVRRNFFWGGGGGDPSGKKMTWVKWVTTCLPYGLGGLNVGSLKGKNLALLDKWWWRFKTETNCLWFKIIRSIHGIDSGLRSGDGLAHLPSLSIWHNIIIVGNQIEDLKVPFICSFKKSIGNGRSSSFWNEIWCGSDCFKNLFPRLYRLETNKEAMVSDRVVAQCNIASSSVTDNSAGSAVTVRDSIADRESRSVAQPQQVQAGPNRPMTSAPIAAGPFSPAAAHTHVVRVTVAAQNVIYNYAGHVSGPSQSPTGVVFNWEWSRNPTGRTSFELTELSNLLRSISFDLNSQESWRWSLAPNGIFTVKKLYQQLDKEILGYAVVNHPQESLRNNLVPKKIEIFVWRALKKRLPVRVELDKRGIDLHSVRCPICDDDLESVDHSLINCKFSMDVWSRHKNEKEAYQRMRPGESKGITEEMRFFVMNLRDKKLKVIADKLDGNGNVLREIVAVSEINGSDEVNGDDDVESEVEDANSDDPGSLN
ncbi:uncharacterized protein [Rutidosis leptorrhynchoides]|uniref:uncharacterized protein n=1 Tax=Rutidosis leptorrhynchoides TaxID=125765 RepID=UPI003A9A3E45